MTTLTREQKDQARADKAAKERKRRAKIKAMERAGLDPKMPLEAEQRERAETAADTHAALEGRALAAFILDGHGIAEQVAQAQEQRQTRQREERSRTNATRSSDPEASELARTAKEAAPDVKSSFLPKEGREFLDTFTVDASSVDDKGGEVLVSRVIDGGAVEVSFDYELLHDLARKGEKNKEVAAGLRTLGKDTRLWGRKLALFIDVTVDAQS